jgi:hypothetical protein
VLQLMPTLMPTGPTSSGIQRTPDHCKRREFGVDKKFGECWRH